MSLAKYFLIGLFIGIGAGSLYRLFAAPHDNILMDSEMGRFRAVFLADEPSTNNYDIMVEAKSKSETPAPAVRIFCQAQDTANYTAMEVSAQSARLLSVEDGRCRELAAWHGPTAAQGDFPRSLRLRCRLSQIEAICDGRILLSALCEPVRRGKVGVGAVGVEISPLTLQPVAPVIFADDFMRAADENGAWLLAGEAEWQVRSLANPARSSNAFVFQGKGEKGGCALVGREYWDRYQVEVSVLGPSQGEVGLVLAASDTMPRQMPWRYALVRWSAQLRDNDDEAGAGKMEIVQVIDGKETVLAARHGGYRVGRWYRLGGRLANNRFIATIDGRPVLSAVSHWFSGGCAGPYIKAAEPAEFDDFTITPLTALEADDFARMPWAFLAGRWQSDEGALCCWPVGASPAIALTAGEWEDVAISCRVHDIKGAVGLIAAFRDPGHYLAYIVDPQNAEERLLQIKRGSEKILVRGPRPGIADGAELHLRLDRGLVQGGEISAFVTEPLAGRIGLAAFGSAPQPIRFHAFSAHSLPQPSLVTSVNEIFDEEDLMAIWAGGAGDWQAERSDGAFEQVYWHRCSFPGDAEIEAILPEERPEKWQVGLSLAKSGRGKGYILFLQVEARNKRRLRLLRDGEEVAASDIPDSGEAFRLALRRAGPWLIGMVNEQSLLIWRDLAPLVGGGAAWAAKGIHIDPGAVTLQSRAVQDENFNRAAADWRPAGGVWMVANRWECDPRWSFVAGMPPALAERRLKSLEKFLPEDARWSAEMLQSLLALVPDRQSKLAALWHKGEFAGDVVLECFVAQMMDNTRGGGDYRRYVQNFCVSLGADGRDLDSGYSFLFGAEGNTKSQIWRGREIVAESRDVIPVTANIHRKWFRLRAEKRGSEISFSAFTQEQRGAPERQLLALSFRDPTPLSGKRVAIWTWDNGILVARVRIAGSQKPEMEEPFLTYPEVARCVYTPRQ